MVERLTWPAIERRDGFSDQRKTVPLNRKVSGTSPSSSASKYFVAARLKSKLRGLQQR
jgi:hypothetical protein